MSEILSTSAKKAKSNNKKYKCPYCEKRLTRIDMVTHIENFHEDMIPKGYTVNRVVFNTINKKDHGRCVICGKESPWNEKTCKYDRLCGRDACRKESARRNVLENLRNWHSICLQSMANWRRKRQTNFCRGFLKREMNSGCSAGEPLRRITLIFTLFPAGSTLGTRNVGRKWLRL